MTPSGLGSEFSLRISSCRVTIKAEKHDIQMRNGGFGTLFFSVIVDMWAQHALDISYNSLPPRPHQFFLKILFSYIVTVPSITSQDFVILQLDVCTF